MVRVTAFALPNIPMDAEGAFKTFNEARIITIDAVNERAMVF
jgi:hypothetical protein